MIKAIPTRYRGHHFRSRLEARWAVFFDALGLRWEYEPQGFELSEGVKYLPDFKVHHENGNPFWFEVKGEGFTTEDIKKLWEVAHETNIWGFISARTPDVPEIINGQLQGAMILGFLPLRDFLGEGRVGTVDMIRENCLRTLCGFYEDGERKICLDHLYREDLPIQDKSDSRMVEKLTVDGQFVPAINLGQGREYRNDRLKKAYAASRSARFEHGENGAT